MTWINGRGGRKKPRKSVVIPLDKEKVPSSTVPSTVPSTENPADGTLEKDQNPETDSQHLSAKIPVGSLSSRMSPKPVIHMVID